MRMHIMNVPRKRRQSHLLLCLAQIRASPYPLPSRMPKPPAFSSGMNQRCLLRFPATMQSLPGPSWLLVARGFLFQLWSRQSPSGGPKSLDTSRLGVLVEVLRRADPHPCGLADLSAEWLEEGSRRLVESLGASHAALHLPFLPVDVFQLPPHRHIRKS